MRSGICAPASKLASGYFTEISLEIWRVWRRGSAAKLEHQHHLAEGRGLDDFPVGSWCVAQRVLFPDYRFERAALQSFRQSAVDRFAFQRRRRKEHQPKDVGLSRH